MKRKFSIINGIKFIRSSYSGKYLECVGVAKSNGKILVTNTDTKKGLVEFSEKEWEIFIKGVKNNEFDLVSLNE